ncbi:MAG TPA: tyrosine-type recombinase/integrase [Shinella sp.]|uniref:tyrosine-type recombinase/integrase n=1 Tax=Shinella sp. TaxID=1870904 RepID=UPI002E0EBD3F|nr:tyrosine-type recombinase/integrase [Shinella sp.]
MSIAPPFILIIGKPWTYNGFSTNWDKFKKALEKDGSIQPGRTLKSLRHTVATILAEMGKDSGTVQLVLGHATERWRSTAPAR